MSSRYLSNFMFLGPLDEVRVRSAGTRCDSDVAHRVTGTSDKMSLERPTLSDSHHLT